jgi:hypothetical protein
LSTASAIDRRIRLGVVARRWKLQRGWSEG